MKINPNAYNIGKLAGAQPFADKKASPNRGGNVGKAEANKDTITISHEGAMKADTDMLTRAVVAEMEAPAEPSRLEELKAAVSDGSYHVPTSDLADSLMRRWIGVGE